jgi:hypothetical protein
MDIKKPLRVEGGVNIGPSPYTPTHQPLPLPNYPNLTYTHLPQFPPLPLPPPYSEVECIGVVNSVAHALALAMHTAFFFFMFWHSYHCSFQCTVSNFY